MRLARAKEERESDVVAVACDMSGDQFRASKRRPISVVRPRLGLIREVIREEGLRGGEVRDGGVERSSGIERCAMIVFPTASALNHFPTTGSCNSVFNFPTATGLIVVITAATLVITIQKALVLDGISGIHGGKHVPEPSGG
jgi:hypothetical protein